MSQLYPIIGYQDARAAVDWLEAAFGFRPHLVVDGDDDRIAHAELQLDGDDGPIVMIGSIQNDTLGLRTPGDLGGAVTSGTYVALDDLDAHYARARAVGAEIVQGLVDDGYGRRYSAHDLEGHLWVFGTYRPID